MNSLRNVLRYLVYGTMLCLCINSCQSNIEESTSDISLSDIALTIPFDFAIEEIYSPSENKQGSWVSITQGPGRRFYTCDQYGGLYTFEMPEIGDTLSADAVDSIEMNMGYAQGLLWAFNSLYVVVVKSVNEDSPEDPSSGVYRLTDEDGDGTLDKQVKILTVSGTSEHGPHTLRVSPDGQSLYFIAGNFNLVPDHFKSRLPRNWDEDNLLKPYLDASGHAIDLKAPGGWLAKTDPEGKEWELIGAGMRNPFSFGINDHGELFAYDADMEWDFGMPWYRPTRILHVTSGSEFGWRTGSGKWPVYYPDNLPAVENMSQGSPTAVIMGKDLSFPAKYKDGLFACDWSFGTIYYVDLKESGSSYEGKKEEFLSGIPLPITNATAGSDGNLYFLTGGRRLASRLFRVRYTGIEDTDINPSPSDPEATALRGTRKKLEAFHTGENPEAVSASWSFLDHPDRHIRYAARIAIEHQPLESWITNLWTEDDPVKMTQGAIAYARSGGEIGKRITTKLTSINYKKLSDEDRIAWARSIALLLARNDYPSGNIVQSIINKVNPLYPATDSKLNRILSEIMIYLNAPEGVQKTMALLDAQEKDATTSHPEILSKKLLERSEQYGPQIADMLDNMPPTEAIYYVTVLSHAKEGWTKELRTNYFSWFDKALRKKGGVSYKAFLDNIRAQALTHVPDAEKDYFNQLAGFYSPMTAMANLPKPIGPGKNYNMYDLGRIATWGDDKIKNYERDYAAGFRAYQAALCSSCHRMNGEGGASGPDLSNINTRFNKNEIVTAILNPHETISDQYSFTSFNLKDGSRRVGRVVNESDDNYTIFQSPYDITATVEIAKSDITSQEESAISPMPAKLLNPLNEDEVLDLMVYLLAGGKADSELY